MPEKHNYHGLVSARQLFKDGELSLREFIGLVMTGLVTTYDGDAKKKDIRGMMKNLINREYEGYLEFLSPDGLGIKKPEVSVYGKIEKDN